VRATYYYFDRWIPEKALCRWSVRSISSVALFSLTCHIVAVHDRPAGRLSVNLMCPITACVLYLLLLISGSSSALALNRELGLPQIFMSVGR